MADAQPADTSLRNIILNEPQAITVGLMEKHLRIYWDCEKEGEQGLLALQGKLETFTAFAIAAFFFFLFLELQYFIAVPFEVAFVFIYLFHIYDIVMSSRRYHKQ